MNSSLIQHKLFLFRLKEQFHSQPNKCIILFLWCHSYKRQDCIKVADFGFMWYCILMWHGSKPVFYYIFQNKRQNGWIDSELSRTKCIWNLTLKLYVLKLYVHSFVNPVFRYLTSHDSQMTWHMNWNLYDTQGIIKPSIDVRQYSREPLC